MPLKIISHLLSETCTIISESQGYSRVWESWVLSISKPLWCASSWRRPSSERPSAALNAACSTTSCLPCVTSVSAGSWCASPSSTSSPKTSLCGAPEESRNASRRSRRSGRALAAETGTAQDEGHSRDSNKDGEPKHSKPAAELSDAKKQVDSVMRDDAEKLSEGSSEDQEPGPEDAASVELALSNGTGVNNGEMVSDETSKQVTQKPEQAAEFSDASCEHVAGSSADCDDSRDEMDPADTQEEPEGASEDRTVTDSPKHKEKLPRPGLTMTSVQKNCTQSNGSEKEEPMDTSSNLAH